jgi:AraC family transcriptional regulator, ethanolamine operon transcriptional activator
MYVNYQTFEDADRHAHALSGWDQRYDQVGEGTFRSFVKQVATEHVQVFQESANVRMVQRGQLPPGRATFGLMLGGGAPFSFQGVKVDESALIFTAGAKEFTLHSPPDMSMLGVAIDLDLLERVADREGFELEGGVLAQQVLNIPAAAGTRAGRRIVSAVEAAIAEPESFSRASFADTVAESILDLLAFNVPTHEDRLTYACRADVVRRSHDLVLAQPEQPVSIMDLCANLRISRRTVQNSFQSVTQMNPIAYLRAVRLAQVRRLLKTTSPQEVPVREAAMRWGFSNLGHFASDYKSHFGELPSQTTRLR